MERKNERKKERLFRRKKGKEMEYIGAVKENKRRKRKDRNTDRGM